MDLGCHNESCHLLKTLNENALFEVYIICGKVIRIYDFQYSKFKKKSHTIREINKVMYICMVRQISNAATLFQ